MPGIVSKADEITAGIADAYGKVRAIHDWGLLSLF